MFLKRFGPYFSYLKPVRKQFALGLGFGLISAAASGAGLPFIIQYLVPLVTSDDKPEEWLRHDTSHAARRLGLGLGIGIGLGLGECAG